MDEHTKQEHWNNTGGTNPFSAPLQDLLDNQPTGTLFSSEEKFLYCIDEGTPGPLAPGGIHLAGSGILADKEKVVEWLRPLGITEVTAHEGCGAAALYASQNGIEDNSDDEGIKFSEWLAEALETEYDGQVTKEDMGRPEGFHTARAVYYDGTGMLQAHHSETLPLGFTISRGAFPEEAKDYMLQELDVAISIALGNHGFGEKFTAESPFYVCVIGNPAHEEKSADVLTAEVQSTVAQYGDRVKVVAATPKDQ